MALLAPYGPFRAFDSNGDPLNGGKLFTYEAGTSTPKATFTDEGGLTANANPVILDANGYANVWLGSGGYKFILKDSADVTLWTIDNIGGDSANAFGSTIVTTSTNLSVTSVHKNALIRCTAALTLSLLAAASAEEGFYFLATNASSGNITIDPNGAETIDGASTYTLYPNDSVIVICSGTTWFTAFALPVAGITTNQITTSGASGVVIRNSAGTTVATIGASAGTVTALAGNLTLGGTLSGASITDNTLTYAKIASAAIGSTAETVSGTASKLVVAANLAPLFYGCKAYQTTGTSIANAAWTTILFDTELWDDDNFHSTSVNTERFTFNFTGRACVIASYDAGSSANAVYGMRALRNAGATVVARTLVSMGAAAGAGGNQQVILAFDLDVTSGDYIYFQAWQAIGGATTSGTGIAGTSVSITRTR